MARQPSKRMRKEQLQPDVRQLETVETHRRVSILAKTQNQADLIHSIRHHEVSAAIGPAG